MITNRIPSRTIVERSITRKPFVEFYTRSEEKRNEMILDFSRKFLKNEKNKC
jgi:hypothetical protein